MTGPRTMAKYGHQELIDLFRRNGWQETGRSEKQACVRMAPPAVTAFTVTVPTDPEAPDYPVELAKAAEVAAAADHPHPDILTWPIGHTCRGIVCDQARCQQQLGHFTRGQRLLDLIEQHARAKHDWSPS